MCMYWRAANAANVGLSASCVSICQTASRWHNSARPTAGSSILTRKLATHWASHCAFQQCLTAKHVLAAPEMVYLRRFHVRRYECPSTGSISGSINTANN